MLCDAADLHPPPSQLSGLLGSAASPQQIKVQSEDKLIGGRWAEDASAGFPPLI